jgi:hypothetical protein
VFLGTAPGPSFRAAAAVLGMHGVEVSPGLGRLVMEYGIVLALDGLKGPRVPLVGALVLEGQGICDGYHPAMLTVSLGEVLGEEYLRLLPQYSGSIEGGREVGFVAMVGVEAGAASQLLTRIRDAATIRMSELPQMVLAVSPTSSR